MSDHSIPHATPIVTSMTTMAPEMAAVPSSSGLPHIGQLSAVPADGATHFILPVANPSPVIIPHGGPFLTGAQVAQALPQRATLVPIASVAPTGAPPHLIQTIPASIPASNAAPPHPAQITLFPTVASLASNGATILSHQTPSMNNLSIITPQQLAECGGLRGRVAILPTGNALQPGYNFAGGVPGNVVESYIDLSGSLESMKSSTAADSSLASGVAAGGGAIASGPTLLTSAAAPLQESVTVGHVFIDAAGKVTSVTPVQFAGEAGGAELQGMQMVGNATATADPNKTIAPGKKVKQKKGKGFNEGIKIKKKLKDGKEEEQTTADIKDVNISGSPKKISHVQHQKFAFSNRNLDHNSEELEEGEIVFNLVKRKGQSSSSGKDGTMDDAEDLDLLDDDVPTVAVNTGQLDRTAINIHVGKSHLLFDTDGRAKWKCDQCPKVYTTKHNLVTHIMGHSGIKPHCCVICGKFFKQLSHLNTHMLIHSSLKPHLCKLCNKSFTQVSHLKRHLTTHQDAKPHICSLCSRGFTYPSELRAHLERHEKMTDNTCIQCGANFSSEKLLEKHLQTQHQKQCDLICTECNRSFHYPSQLRDHMLKHSNIRPFICQDCGMDFMKEHHLKAHQLTHSGVRPYSCMVCGRAFGLKANMQRHVLLHSNQRQFNCNICGVFFSQKQTLNAHMVTHAERKPYQCSICGKEFSRHHNLQGHMTIHTDSRPYKCFCGSTFTLKGNLNRHKKTKHGIQTSDCREEEAAHILKDMSAGGPLSASGSNTDAQDGNVKKERFSPQREDRSAIWEAEPAATVAEDAVAVAGLVGERIEARLGSKMDEGDAHQILRVPLPSSSTPNQSHVLGSAPSAEIPDAEFSTIAKDVVGPLAENPSPGANSALQLTVLSEGEQRSIPGK